MGQGPSRGRIGQVQTQARPDVEYIRLPEAFQGLAKGGRVTVGLRGGRDTGLRTAGRIFTPSRGQVQLPAHQSDVDIPAQHSEHAHLPIADLAHLSDVLAGNAHAFVPRLLLAALIQQQTLFAAERGQTGLHPARYFVQSRRARPSAKR